MLDLKTEFILNEDIVLRGIGDKFWALNVKDGKQFRLNKTSYAILNSLRSETAIGVVVNTMQQAYKVEHEVLLADCENIIRYALDRNIIKEVIL